MFSFRKWWQKLAEKRPSSFPPPRQLEAERLEDRLTPSTSWWNPPTISFGCGPVPATVSSGGGSYNLGNLSVSRSGVSLSIPNNFGVQANCSVSNNGAVRCSASFYVNCQPPQPPLSPPPAPMWMWETMPVHASAYELLY